MLRTLLGALAGMVVTFLAIMGIEVLGHVLYPPPPGLDPMVPQQLERIMATQPAAALALVVVAWVLGAFLGGWVAARIARAHPRIAATLVALLVMAGVVGMIMQMPLHPRWMAVLGLLLPLPAALLAAGLARPRLPA
ncbi:hypothetical protein MQC88_04420 [Luteimonas sp. 50]|uniref:Uncharacterized protein n=1 Tax=Cognatiluteimonas sedimenti TaxID=2927791 RepID=A0ABT0A2J4_9GAMM|nr:hypothetical protein [Lysobacter sedimenti]MCJ0825207.1 hypothetical protein [Lysobacter sedimenti]